jgi:glucose-6-phosphate 1-dehydrogenase
MQADRRRRLSEMKIAFVIFGASGDLAMRMLIPSLKTISCYDSFSPETRIIGVARTAFKGKDLESKLIDAMTQFSRIGPDSGDSYSCEIPTHFLRRVIYIAGNYDDQRTYNKLKEELRKCPFDGVLIYCATPPTLVQTIATGLLNAHVSKTADQWVRIIIEKPFGWNLETAVQLNEKLHKNFTEDQIYRIDHYLAKETVMNIFTFRWGNTLWEPLWNRNFISHVEVLVAELVDVSNRTGYYEGASVLRDMIQNHLLQMLAITAMEPPSVLDAEAIRDEKMKVLHAIRPLTPDDVILGQYSGYLTHNGVPPDSTTPTFAYFRFFIDNWRWQGVPFFVVSGKALKRKKSVVKLVFRSVPHSIFGCAPFTRPNVLKIKIQPHEGIILKQHVKVPGVGLETTEIPLAFHYEDKFGKNALQGAYERVILDAIAGDQSFFTRADEIEQAWRIIDPLLSSDRFVVPYAPGMNVSPGCYDRKLCTQPEVHSFSSLPDLIGETTDIVEKIIAAAIRDNQTCRIALSGGNTPRPIYAKLAESEIAFDKLKIFQVDERPVGPDAAESNFRMINEELISKCGIPDANVHRILGENDPAEAAAQYTTEIVKEFGGAEPEFDLIILGMGPDTHTASLFPGLPAVFDTQNLVIAHFVPQQGQNRVTLGPKVLNLAKNVLFIVTDRDKRRAFDLVQRAPYFPAILPAQVVHPANGKVAWSVLK